MIITIEFRLPCRLDRTEYFNTKTGLFQNQMRGHIEAGAYDFEISNKTKDCGVFRHWELTLDQLEYEVDFVVKLIKRTRKLRKQRRQSLKHKKEIKVGGTD